MDKRERVLAALEGRRVDRVPFTMWRHFYYQGQTADGLALATLDLYRRYAPDMVVLAPGPFYMAEAWGVDVRSFNSDDLAPYLAGPTVGRATDWRQLAELNVASSSLRREIEAVRKVRAGLDGNVPLAVLLYSPLTTADMLCNGRIIDDLRSFSNDVRRGLEVIARATRDLAAACLRAGADGYLFITRLARRDRLRSREYRDFGQQFDLQALDGQDAAVRILHLEGEQPYLELADRYPVQVVCWETWRADPSMARARRQVRSGLMGGINPMTFVGGSVADLRAQVKDAIVQTGGWHLLVAPTGPLPIDAKDELLAATREVMETA
jgi:uroporphyrinogen decarboxylase